MSGQFQHDVPRQFVTLLIEFQIHINGIVVRTLSDVQFTIIDATQGFLKRSDAVDGAFVGMQTILVEGEAKQQFGTIVTDPSPVTNQPAGNLHILFHLCDEGLNLLRLIVDFRLHIRTSVTALHIVEEVIHIPVAMLKDKFERNLIFVVVAHQHRGCSRCRLNVGHIQDAVTPILITVIALHPVVSVQKSHAAQMAEFGSLLVEFHVTFRTSLAVVLHLVDVVQTLGDVLLRVFAIVDFHRFDGCRVCLRSDRLPRLITTSCQQKKQETEHCKKRKSHCM